MADPTKPPFQPKPVHWVPVIKEEGLLQSLAKFLICFTFAHYMGLTEFAFGDGISALVTFVLRFAWEVFTLSWSVCVQFCSVIAKLTTVDLWCFTKGYLRTYLSQEL